MAIVRSVASQKTWGDPWRLLLKCFTLIRIQSPLMIHIVFNNYNDNQTFSVKQTKRLSRAAGKGKRLHIDNDSQEMPQGDECKDFFKEQFKQARSH